MNNEYLLLTGALRVFDDFSKSSCPNFTIEHDVQNPKFELLRNQYSLLEIAGDGDDFSKAVNLMRIVYDNVLHCGGGADADIQGDPISIMEYSFGKGRMPGIYCRQQAVVLTECCLAVGLIARTIHCLPFSPNDFDTHVVSMVYINELNKWVLFDQSNNAYFTDKNGIALSPLEARKLLGRDEVNVCENIQRDVESYKQYMAKNLFYIKFWAKNTFGTDLVDNQTTYHLTPLGFDVKDREIAYCEYAIKNCPEEIKKGWEEALEEFGNQRIHVVSEEQFLRIK
jgi:hypothetical protein